MEHRKSTKFDFRPGKSAARHQQDAPSSLRAPASTLRLGHLSDFHLGKTPADGVPTCEALDRWFEEFERLGVEVLLVTGDLVEEPGDRDGLVQIKEMLDELSFPYLVIPGNHDVADPGGFGPFEELFGTYPQVELCEQMEFVAFDSMKGLPASERSPYDRMQGRTGGAYSRGKVGRAQMDEAEDKLGEAPRFGRTMLVHHHLRTNAPTKQGHVRHPTQPNGLMGPLNDAKALVEWASGQDVRLIFHGHKHQFWDPYEPSAGLIVLNSGSSTLGKPNRPRRGRIVDVWPKMASIAVHDLELRL